MFNEEKIRKLLKAYGARDEEIENFIEDLKADIKEKIEEEFDPNYDEDVV